MATRSTPVRKARRALIWLLVLLVAGAALLGSGKLWWGWGLTPKLALDLKGGTQIILAPKLTAGATVTQEQLDQAVSIIRQRVDAAGVSASEISTQGNNNIVVAIPGIPDAATKQRLEASSKLEIRAVLLSSAATTATASASSSATSSATPAPAPALTQPAIPTPKPSNGSSDQWVTAAAQAQYDSFNCADVDKTDANAADPDKALVTCDATGSTKYLLGPAEVAGTAITNAQASTVTSSAGVNTGQWAVNLTLTSDGGAKMEALSSRIISLTAPKNEFGFVLDGKVLLAPKVEGVTSTPQITGNFTQTTAQSLADQLKFGALPISFEVQSEQSISATLGTAQLQSGLIAGLIGLALVFIYSLFQYRLLGFVTIASLAVAAVATYLVITFLAWQQGYRLSLAGVAGLIVSIGFTADSFIVYFERIRDELRDGRGLVGAVEAGWKRAIRTIFAAKGVNLLSALVLYFLAVGDVRGFAVTLGITTVIDVLVVLLFTHPTLQLLATTRFFSSGHPLSGLDPTALGAIYRGRAQFAVTTEQRRAGASREAAKRQTIAERKAAELAASAEAAPKVIEASVAPAEPETSAASTTAETTPETTVSPSTTNAPAKSTAPSGQRQQPKRRGGQKGGKR